jgi:hypothetical protein
MHTMHRPLDHIDKLQLLEQRTLRSTPGSKSFVTEIDRNLLISVLNEIVPFNAPKIDSVHAKHG